MGDGERHRAQPVAPGAGRGALLRGAPDAPRPAALEPGGNRRGTYRRRRQGHRDQALRLRLSRRRHAGLAGDDLARHSRPRARCDARLHGSRPRASQGRARARCRGDRRRSCEDRHPRARVLRRRPPLPHRQDAALSRPAGGAADLRAFRRVRSGAARVARRDLREVRRGDRPHRGAQLRCLPLHARGGPDARRARRLFADPGRLDQSRAHPGFGASGVVAARQADAGQLRQGRPSTASRSGPSSPPRTPRSWCSIASSRRSRSTRCSSSPKPASPGSAATAASSSSCSACSRPTTRPRPSPSCSARPVLPSSLPASTRTSPTWAAASAGATTRPSCSTSHWRGCSFPAGRCASPTTAISSSRAASSVTPSRCARRSASTARRARSAPSPPIMSWMAAASPTIRPTSPPWPRPPPSASTTCPRSTSPRWRCTRAA